MRKKSTFPPAKDTEIELAPTKGKTRHKLLRAGLKLLSDPAVTLVTIDEFVQHARVAKGSFYNHFADREELEREVLKYARDTFHEYVVRSMGEHEDPAVRAARSVCATACFALDYPGEARILQRWVNSIYPLNFFSDDTLNEVQAGITSERFTLPSVEAGCLLLLGLGRSLFMYVLSGEAGHSTLYISQQIVFIALRGLGIEDDEAMRISTSASESMLRPYLRALADS